MTSNSKIGRWPTWAIFTLLWLIGIELRLTILAVPPVMPLIHHDLHLSETLVGALSSLPVLLFATVAVPGSLIISRVGARRTILLGLLLVAVGSGLRGLLPSAGWLFAMTLLMGAGIAIMQPAMPPIVSEWTPGHVAFATALYSNGILVGEAIAAALTLPVVLPLAGGSWRMSFALWAIPAALTLLLAVLCRSGAPARAHPTIAATPSRWWPDWRDARTWQLGLIFGSASCLYFGVNAFIPDYLHHTHRDALTGMTLSVLNLAQIPASFILLRYAQVLTRRRIAFTGITCLGFASVLGIVWMPGSWIILWSGVAGFCCAFILILCLALPPQLVGHGDMARLSAAMFTISYAMAVIVPVLGGMLWDYTGRAPLVFLPVGLYSAMAIFLTRYLKLGHRAPPGA